jgi:hypothetical protein
MKRALRTMIVCFLVCVLPSFALAAPTVYPVREVFGFNTPLLSVKAPVFAKWIASKGADARYALGNDFDTAFRKEFGALAAENVTDVNKHEVLVASLHLIRASQYVVPKLGNDEVHMPLTLSIVITNPSTGEVIYSFTSTSYVSALVSKSESETETEKLFPITPLFCRH